MLGAIVLLVPVSAALAVSHADEASAPNRFVPDSTIAGVDGDAEEATPRIVYPGEVRAEAGHGPAEDGGAGDEASEPDAQPQERAIDGGEASYYGLRFAGRGTASGEPFNPVELTAAHRTLPFGSRVKVTNKPNGRSVIVRINDRGPFHHKRVIDLSREAAKRIGLLSRGGGPVRLALLLN